MKSLVEEVNFGQDFLCGLRLGSYAVGVEEKLMRWTSEWVGVVVEHED